MAPETSPKDPEFVELVESPPGGPLRQARQSLNFGQLDVARRLNLTVDVINALEENRFSDLPEATYVKGYLRSYARFLEIDSNPLINAYEQLVQPEHRSALSSSAKGDSAQRAAATTPVLISLEFMLLPSFCEYKSVLLWFIALGFGDRSVRERPKSELLFQYLPESS